MVYKPHPDVVAGLRQGTAMLAEGRAWCDEIVTDVPIHRLFDAVDEVELLTSLAGFEALLRGKTGHLPRQSVLRRMGLTTDLLPHPGARADSASTRSSPAR